MVAEIVSTGSFLPGEPISNARMEQLVGPLPEDVLEGIQVTQRHWMVDLETGEHLVNNSEMAVNAARDALANAGIDASEVDLLVLSTASPDYLLPPLVTFVQEALGLERCATMLRFPVVEVGVILVVRLARHDHRERRFRLVGADVARLVARLGERVHDHHRPIARSAGEDIEVRFGDGCLDEIRHHPGRHTFDFTRADRLLHQV